MVSHRWRDYLRQDVDAVGRIIYNTAMKKHQSNLEYQVVFQEESEGGFSVWVPDLPGCASQGETLEEALENIKEAIGLYVENSDIPEDASDYEYKRQFVVPVKLAHA